MNVSEELLKTDREFSAYSSSHSPGDAFAKYLTSDAVILPNHKDAIYGLKQIVESMRGNYVLTWVPSEAVVSTSGDLGYTWGKYKLTTPDGKIEHGKYVNVWEKQNGTWRVAVDIGNLS